MYLQGAKMSKYSIYACFGVSLLLFSKLKIKLLHKIWRSSSTADPRHYKSRATDIHTPLHSLLKKNKNKNHFPPFFGLFLCSPATAIQTQWLSPRGGYRKVFVSQPKDKDNGGKKYFGSKDFLVWQFYEGFFWLRLERKRERERENAQWRAPCKPVPQRGFNE